MTEHQATHVTTDSSDNSSRFTQFAPFIARYALVVVFVWFAGLKVTSYEAQGISPLVAHSPLLNWAYTVVSVQTFSVLLGCAELVTAVLLAVKPWAPKLSIIGGALAALFFLGTLSFMITTPGIGEATAGGFPVLSATGEFLDEGHCAVGFGAVAVVGFGASQPPCDCAFVICPRDGIRSAESVSAEPI
jgi:uncharacterized membrane protein YkgB